MEPIQWEVIDEYLLRRSFDLIPEAKTKILRILPPSKREAAKRYVCGRIRELERLRAILNHNDLEQELKDLRRRQAHCRLEKGKVVLGDGSQLHGLGCRCKRCKR